MIRSDSLTLGPLLVVAFVGWLGAEAGCARRRPAAPPVREASLTVASLPFDRQEDDLTLEMVRSLDAIAWRAWPGGAVRVLIVAYANDHQALAENLELADRRGRAVVKHLVSRGVDRRQIVMTAREATSDDPRGTRCDVEVLEPSVRPES